MNFKEWVPWNRKKDANLAKADTDHPIFSLQREMNNMFDNFSRSFFDPFNTKEFGFNQSAFTKLDVVETEKEIKVTAELPGMEENDIEVTFSGDALVIEGEKKEEQEDKKEGYYLMERSYGSFHRAVPIPKGVDREKVEAEFKNGVLKVSLPKTEEAQKEIKKIKVNSN
ncbi:MAG: Hsp20/alpha crystallin family protein [Nitrospinota bacterium]